MIRIKLFHMSSIWQSSKDNEYGTWSTLILNLSKNLDENYTLILNTLSNQVNFVRHHNVRILLHPDKWCCRFPLILRVLNILFSLSVNVLESLVATSYSVFVTTTACIRQNLITHRQQLRNSWIRGPWQFSIGNLGMNSGQVIKPLQAIWCLNIDFIFIMYVSE